MCGTGASEAALMLPKRAPGGHRPRIALLMLDTPDLTGGGGAERQFADLYDAFQGETEQPFEVFAVVDKQSYRNLRAVGRLKRPERVVVVQPGWTGWERFAGHAAALTRALLAYRFDLVHLVLPKWSYLPW